jgi:hypothetical protein
MKRKGSTKRIPVPIPGSGGKNSFLVDHSFLVILITLGTAFLLAITVLVLSFAFPCEYYEHMGDGDPTTSLTGAGGYGKYGPAGYIYRDGPFDDVTFPHFSTMVECKGGLEDVRRIAYLHMQSDRLQSDVNAWRGNGHVSPPALNAKLRSVVGINDLLPSGQTSNYMWGADYALKYAPKWVPHNQITYKSLIAAWGNGYLFAGAVPGEFYWIGFR